MGDGIFNQARGKVGYYAGLPGADDSLIVVLLQSTGLEADDVLNNYDDLAAVLAASNDEATFTNYTRVTLASVAGTVDDALNRLDVDAADWTYTSPGGAVNNTIGKALICYKPTSGAADSAIVPLTYHDLVWTTNGTDQPIQVPTGGFYRNQ